MFKETPDEKLTEANLHSRLGSSEELLNDASFIWFSDKNVFTFTLATPKIHRE